MNQPSWRLTDPRNPWIPAVATDIRVRFEAEKQRIGTPAKRIVKLDRSYADGKVQRVA